MLLYIVDATDRSRRDAAKDMLFGELRHRMKNLLAVAQSIARQTTTKGRSAEEENSRLPAQLGGERLAVGGPARHDGLRYSTHPIRHDP